MALVVAMACAAATGSDGRLSVELGALDGPGWSLQELSLEVTGTRAELRVARLSLPAPLGVIHGVRVVCPKLSLTAAGLSCGQARIAGRSGAGEQAFDAELALLAARRAVSVRVSAMALAGGTVTLEALLGADALNLDARFGALSLPAIARWAPEIAARAGEMDITAGELHGSTRLALDGSRAGTGRLELEVTDLAFNDASGRFAAEGIVARTVADLSRAAGAPWQIHLESGIGAGGVYAEPVYLDFSSYPLALTATIGADPAAGRLHVSRFTVEQPELARLSGSLLAARGQPLARLSLAVERAALPGAYDAWLQGALVGTPFGRLDVAGDVVGRLEVVDGSPVRFEARLDSLDLEDRDGRFALYGAAGEVHWQHDTEAAPDSRLTFDGGFVHGAGFDGSTVTFRLAGTDAELLAPVRVPALGGALHVRRLDVRAWDGEDISLELEAEVEPIELRQLTLALDWPAFGGTLSGRLPLLNYRDGVVSLGGSLEARAFDGDVAIERLRIVRPFGVVPELAATVRLRNLDLGQITDVVPFGSVSGRLDGDIEGLRMIKGEPIAFDARFRTPEDDDSKHRISQRAIGTISKVAGGGGAVLSSTFLSVFRSFPYERLGLSCRLENDVCHMDGIAPAEAGYYIVEGALLPRLNLIGRVREVNWSRLMGQLRQALAEGEFEID